MNRHERRRQGKAQIEVIPDFEERTKTGVSGLIQELQNGKKICYFLDSDNKIAIVKAEFEKQLGKTIAEMNIVAIENENTEIPLTTQGVITGWKYFSRALKAYGDGRKDIAFINWFNMSNPNVVLDDINEILSDMMAVIPIPEEKDAN